MRNLLKKPKFKKKNFKSDFEEQFLKKETLQSYQWLYFSKKPYQLSVKPI